MDGGANSTQTRIVARNSIRIIQNMQDYTYRNIAIVTPPSLTLGACATGLQ